MNRDKVIDAVRYIMQGPRAFEADRLERIAEAIKPWTPESAQVPPGGLRAHRRAQHVGMKWRSQTNFLPLVLDVFSQSMKVDNYLSSKTKETAGPWEWWQRNKMIARQTGLIRSVLQYGVAFTTVLPSLNPIDGKPGAYIRAMSPAADDVSVWRADRVGARRHPGR